MNDDVFSELREDELGVLHGGVCENNTDADNGSTVNFFATNGNCLGGGWGDTNTNCTGTCKACSV
jgi:hypothetical protein